MKTQHVIAPLPLFIAFLLICIGEVRVRADGVYYDQGGNIQPLESTKISMDRETLVFQCHGTYASVSVYFEFNNPTDEDITHRVGFEIWPPADEAFCPDSSIQEIVRDFRIMHEGKVLPYQLMLAEHEEAELVPATGELEWNMAGVFTYLFEITFHPGVNRVKKSYEINASGNLLNRWEYHFSLATTFQWAGNRVKNFTLILDPGKNEYFEVLDIFGEDAEWNIIGTGHLLGETRGMRRARILSGQLIVRAENLNLTDGIHFRAIGVHGFVSPDPYEFLDAKLRDSDMLQHYDMLRYLTLRETSPGEFTREQLQFMRDYVYAMHGYPFQDPDTRAIFSSFEWYFPIPNLGAEDIQFRELEQEFLNKISKLENTLD